MRNVKVDDKQTQGAATNCFFKSVVRIIGINRNVFTMISFKLRSIKKVRMKFIFGASRFQIFPPPPLRAVGRLKVASPADPWDFSSSRCQSDVGRYQSQPHVTQLFRFTPQAAICEPIFAPPTPPQVRRIVGARSGLCLSDA